MLVVEGLTGWGEEELGGGDEEELGGGDEEVESSVTIAADMTAVSNPVQELKN